jgi:hypothetical protein
MLIQRPSSVRGARYSGCAGSRQDWQLCQNTTKTQAGPAPDLSLLRMALAVNFRKVVHSALTENSEVAKHQRFAENRMDIHKNAPLTPKVERRWCAVLLTEG